MFEDINFHRAAVADHIAKSFINDFGSEEDLEKAHKVGDVHPNGKWVWKEYAPGKFDWRGIKGGSSSGGASAASAPMKPVSKPQGQPQASASQGQKTSDDSASKISSLKKTIDENRKEISELETRLKEIENLSSRSATAKQYYKDLYNKTDEEITTLRNILKKNKNELSKLESEAGQKATPQSQQSNKPTAPAQQSAPAKRPQAPIQKPQAPATKTAQQKLKTNFQDAKDLAESIAKFVGGKAKQRKDIWGFGNCGDYGATTAVKDVYEVNIDDTHKIQIGIANGNSKSWMQPVKGEIVIRSAVKKSNNAGKKVFKWWSDAIKSYKPGEDFNKFVDSMPGTQKGIFRKLYE